ncbi:MAG: leucine-rich repeat protein, partial [Clostridia bacterium]|nr:leucine-rich repeat protein [Clostridia bacterium]
MILAVSLIVGILPFRGTHTFAADVVGSGTCGENLTWTLDSAGTLTISGTGAMTDYYGSGEAPWKYSNSYNYSVYKVVIEDGVTSIGKYAFSNCWNLRSVAIPGSVTSIRNSAFYYCERLTSVSIPDGVKAIGDSAFSGCSGLTSVAIPESVTIIGDSAFEGCSGLTFVTIPENVKLIGDSAFYGCKGLESVTIPDGVKAIGNSAFYYCTGLTSVSIPDGLTSIGKNAFYYCRGLESVTIPGSVTSIGNYAFYGCKGLESIAIPENVTSIGDRTFSGCSGLERITVAAGNTVYHSAGNCLIRTASKALVMGCKNSVIPNDGSVTRIGSYAFSGCSGLTSVTIPESVTIINDHAFSDCDGLTFVTIPESVTSIDDYAFYGCEGLTSVVIPGSVTSIGYCAFEDCYSLTDVYYLASEEEWDRVSVGQNNYPLLIADFHFGCGEALTWRLDGGGTLTISGTGAMTDYGVGETPWYSSRDGIHNVVITDGVTSIGDRAFYGCSGLASVTIPGSMTSIGDSAFLGCTGIESITVAPGNTVYHSAGNCLIETETKTLILGCKNSVIPNDGSVTSIGDSAFYGCEGLTFVVIPDGVTAIGAHAFYECTDLESVAISGSVTTIGDSAFYGCESLADVYCSASEEEWNRVSVGSENDPLLNAVFHFGHTHAYGEWTVIKEATCAAEGEKACTCAVCHATKTESVARDTNKHTWNDGVITIVPTCASEGVKTYTCTVCNATKTEPIAKDANNHVGGTVVRDARAATYEANGYTGDTYCKGCGAKLSSGKIIPALKPSTDPWEEVTTESSEEITTESSEEITTDPSDDPFYFIPGDIDRDGYVTPKDARLALRIAAKIEDCTWIQAKAADVDCNGVVNILDARIILRWAAKLDEEVTTDPIGGSQSGPPKVCAVSDKTEVAIGEEITVTVKVENARGMMNGAAWLTFDTSLLKLVSTGKGDTNAYVYTPVKPAEIARANTEGQIRNSFAYWESEENETVTIYTATFEAIGSGTAAFGFAENELINMTIGNVATVTVGYPTVCAVSDKTEVSIGEEITITVKVDNARGMISGAAWLTFDTSLLKLLRTGKGDTNAYVYTPVKPDEIAKANTEGQIRNSFAYWESEENETVTIYTATFEAIGAGTAVFGFAEDELMYLTAGNTSTVTVDASPANHSWDDGVVTKESTCDEDGEMTYTCSLCGETRTESIPAPGHDYGAWTLLNETQHQRVCANDPTHIEKENHTWDEGVVTTEPTCDVAGVRTYTCTVCDATKTETIDALGHDYGAWKRLNATQHQRVCANDPTHVEKADHTWNAGIVTTEPTCDENGVKTYTCTVCNATKIETIDELGHDYGAWTRLNATQHQRVCANDPTHVEKANHKWDAGVVTTEPTCDDTGVMTYTCTVCSATKTETVDELGHDYGAWTRLNATQHQRVCANDPTHVEKANHKWNEGIVTTEPTCEETGVKTYTCTVCRATKTETLDKLGHDYGAWKRLNATQHQRVCANDPTHIEKANHTWNAGVVTTEPTCEETGVKTYTCTVCRATKTETIDELGHDYGAWKRLNATQHQRVCANDPEHIEKANHTWNAGVVTTEPTCDETGVMTYTCTVCSATKTEPITKNASNHTGGTEIRNVRAATCGEDGYIGDTYCKGCGVLLSSGSVIPATGNHVWNAGEVTTQATETTNGIMTYTCTVCGATKTELIPAIGDTMTVVIDSLTATVGDEIDVYLTLNKAFDVKSMSISGLSYDKSKMTLTGGEWLVTDATIDTWDISTQVGAVAFETNKELSGKVFRLSFKVLDDIEDCEVTVNCAVNGKTKPADSAESPIPVFVTPGVITI